MPDIKIKRNNVIAAAVFFLLLNGYCLLVGVPQVIALLLTVYGAHLFLFKKEGGQRLLQLGLLLAVVAAAAQGMTFYSHMAAELIPVASVAMLTMLLFNDLQLAFSISFVAAALVSLIVGTNVELMITTFLGGLTGAYAVRGARTRGKLLIAGLLVGAVQALAYLLSYPEWASPFVLDHLRWLFISGLLSAGATLVTLKVFEMLFGELTNFSLLELSDSLNQPLLKRLAFEAPGTYHHSLVVSNLAGAAAEEIGANALLVRVGSYYHDIGKLVKPEYFTENQAMSENKHDDLEPTMSRLVILNHVKEGAELASRQNLNRKIIDFIYQHHGTSLIHYFYQRALEDNAIEEVDEGNFRYPGPRPQTREIALVMLADSVEGATRALEEHTPNRINELVRKVINNKFIDGQLDDCSLTLREIEDICESFSRTLCAMYHVRVRYPNPKKDGQ